jgi:hypothetical protein
MARSGAVGLVRCRAEMPLSFERSEFRPALAEVVEKERAHWVEVVVVNAGTARDRTARGTRGRDIEAVDQAGASALVGWRADGWWLRKFLIM